MLQTILERILAAVGQLSVLSKTMLDRGLIYLDAALPSSSRHRKWVIVGVFSMPVLGAVVAIAGSVENPQMDTSNLPTVQEAIQLNVDSQGVFNVAPLVAEEKIHRGDTIVSLLQRMGVNTDGLTNFLMGDKVASNLVNLRAGRVITVQQDVEGNLVWLRYKSSQDNDAQRAILVERKNGVYSARFEDISYDRGTVARAGKIDSSLFAAADKAGLPDAITIQLANIFSSEIDFHRELRQGDSFRVVYEDLSVDGRSVSSGRILAAEFINDNHKYTAYWFDSKNQTAGYYDENGRSLKKSFLRSPLAFSRITSGFTTARFHPILKKWKAHTGVDYAAARGTPIMATANGTIKFIGQQRGYGNVIEIQHYSGYSTLYGHMNNFAKGMHRGTKVNQGEVIGYVGSTGWATGPHVHYEFRVNEVPRNPLTITVAQSEPLNKAAMADFKRTQASLERKLDTVNGTQVARAE